jgi:hypothetical protein
MSSIATIAATTELEAVNVMLAAIGEAPVSDLEATTQADVRMALDALRSTMREVLSQRWRFNTEFGFTLMPAGIVEYGTTPYNVFTVPADLASFELSRVPEQRDFDIIVRPSRLYAPGTRVFYDRLNGRDGLALSSLKIDPVWFLGFTDCPEAARRYIVVRAARRFQQSTVGSTDLDGFTSEDEAKALEALRMDQITAVPVLPEGTPGSVTDALNLILVNAGQEPVASADSILGNVPAAALNVLRTTLREIQRRGWRFNTEFGLILEAAGTDNEDLNVFTAPEGLADFTVTRTHTQQSTDCSLSASRHWQPGTLVFYDRARNREGWTADTLTINAVWYVPFSDMPEACRWYVTVLAARRFAGRAKGGSEPQGFTGRDEMMALRDLEKSEGFRGRINLFDNADSARHLGGRILGPSGFVDPRNGRR